MGQQRRKTHLPARDAAFGAAGSARPAAPAPARARQRVLSMFMQPMPAANYTGVSRPFVVGLILLMLFLSMQTDWSPQSGRGPLAGKLGAPSAAEMREGAKDKVREARAAGRCCSVSPYL